jgi:hypothetical protein
MNKFFQIIGAIFNTENYTLKNVAFYLIVIMCIQYIPLESRAGVSPIKVATMAIMPLIFITHFKLSKAVGIAFIYMLYIIYTAYFLHFSSFRASTIIYMFMFFITYATFYNLIWVEQVFDMDEFLFFTKRFIYVLVGVLILQQALHIVGISYLPIVNMTQYLRRGVLAGNSLSYEPASLARTLGVLYYAYLKCHEYKQGRPVNIQQIFNEEHRWVTLCFGWAMLTMGSGTAFICLGVLSLYFMKGAYFVFAIPIFIGVYFTLNYFGVQQFERATAVAEATMTGDVNEVRETDGSANDRVAPLLNTINNTNFEKTETWYGHGVDYSLYVAKRRGLQKIAVIDDYGLIAYILTLSLVFMCAMNFFSIATIMYFLGIGGGTGNVAYGWGMLMVFTCVKYFHSKYQQNED